MNTDKQINEARDIIMGSEMTGRLQDLRTTGALPDVNRPALDKFEVLDVEHGNLLGYVYGRDVCHAFDIAERQYAPVRIAIVRVRAAVRTEFDCPERRSGLHTWQARSKHTA